MTPAEADKYATFKNAEFDRVLERHKAERSELIEIKNSCLRLRTSIRTHIEEQGSTPKSADALKWANRKLMSVDSALSRVKYLKNPALEKTGGEKAWVYSLTASTKEPGEAGEQTGLDSFYMASMFGPAEFAAKLWRESEHPDAAPVIMAYFQFPDLDAIPATFWDDTCPSKNEIEADAGKPAIITAS